MVIMSRDSDRPIALPENSKFVTKTPYNVDEDELNRLAAAELLKEAQTLSRIAEVEGALGWKKRRTMKTNKLFLHRTLRQTISSNKRKDGQSPSK